MNRVPLIDPRMLGALGKVAAGSMTATCTITRAGGAPVLNPTTLQLVAPARGVVYDGPCRVQPLPTRERTLNVAGREVAVLRYAVHIPAGYPDVFVDDQVVINSSVDSQLEDVTLAVSDVRLSSLEVERDLVCVQEV